MLQNTNLSYQLYRSISDVDKTDWYQVVDINTDLAMHPNLIRLMEVSLGGQAQFWYVLIRNGQQIAACACVCLFKSDAVQSSPPWVCRAFDLIRKTWPNCLKLKVLFCGLPVPSAETHFRIAPQVEAKPVLALLNSVMQNIAHQQKAHLIVFKELKDAQVNQLGAVFTDLGFQRGDITPTFELERYFQSFDDYQNALRSGYRRQVRQNIKKFAAAGFSARHVCDAKAMESFFTEDVYQLYLNVWHKSDEKLECLPRSFFSQLGHALPDSARLTLISSGEKNVAFTIGLLHNGVYSNLYCGMDYAVNDQADLYFNLYYLELDYAFAQAARKISLGQTSNHFKSRLGALPNRRHFFVRARNPMLHRLLKQFSRLIFPALKPPVKCRVFKDDEMEQALT